jgi:hypothetical protein
MANVPLYRCWVKEKASMKKMLLITAALLIGCASADAAPRGSLPPSMYGKWCLAGTTGKTERYVRGKCKEHEGYTGWLEVAPGALSGHEWGCDVDSIIVVGRAAYQLLSRCGGEGMLSDEKATIWLDGRFLMYRIDKSYNERNETGALECRGHRSTPTDSDADPVVMTLVNLDDGFDVKHVTRSGKVYKRADQYRDVKMWTDDGNVTHWSGIWKRDPNKRMTGSVTRNYDDDDNNRYVEETFDGGRLVTTVTSKCTSVKAE